MEPTNTEYRTALESLYCERAPWIQHWVQRCFPRTCASLVADAVADAFTDALALDGSLFNVWRSRGKTELALGIRQAAWRHLRGHLRKHSTRCEIAMPHLPDTVGVSTPESLYATRETLALMASLIDEAAIRYGGRHRHSLRTALRARFTGYTDVEAARGHQLPREYVNRARRWIVRELGVR